MFCLFDWIVSLPENVDEKPPPKKQVKMTNGDEAKGVEKENSPAKKKDEGGKKQDGGKKRESSGKSGKRGKDVKIEKPEIVSSKSKKEKEDKEREEKEKALPVDFCLVKRAARCIAEETIKNFADTSHCPLPGCDSKGKI